LVISPAHVALDATGRTRNACHKVIGDMCERGATMSEKNELSDRIRLLRSAGIAFDDAVVKRVEQSLAVSLAALDSAVKGSLFDTEPQTFDVVLRRLARSKADV
jgi:hypothetical protein